MLGSVKFTWKLLVIVEVTVKYTNGLIIVLNMDLAEATFVYKHYLLQK